ncbi:Hypothetical protein Minf_0712 [Methylacidiphilum infernorum V4]|uniref:Uncharacterized protein n=2 Tax=Candidatus Methylacidiphilum infernorum TaxID=511746 RepID=B3E0L3_METI4|nr:Hypothetical protein Minf_0712 [Methylacidiphilum infernorum V4]
MDKNLSLLFCLNFFLFKKSLKKATAFCSMKKKEDKRKKVQDKDSFNQSTKKDKKGLESPREDKFDKLVQQNLFYQRLHE